MARRVPVLVLAVVLVPFAMAASAAAAEVTFSKDIAPIFQAKCQECHQPNSIAPMSLITYQDARPWAKSMRERVITRQMPPWHIDRTVGVQKFKNDMSLSGDRIDTIVRWVDSGAQLGDPKDMPHARQWPAENERKAAKALRAPDLVELGAWLYPKGQEPKYRTYLTGFQAVRGPRRTAGTRSREGRHIDIPPNSIVQHDNYTVLKQAAQLENFQPHMHLRGKAMAV